MYGTEVRFKTTRTVFSAYLAPISAKGWITAWKGMHSDYRRGFVLRILWLGVVARWARLSKAERAQRNINYVIDNLLAQAADKDGGFGPDLFPNEEPF